MIPLPGGQVANLSFLICPVLPEMSWGFLLHILSSGILIHLMVVPIVGLAVAVEHIFSGGCDTISLCHANLKPDTIRTLMLVKQCLRPTR